MSHLFEIVDNYVVPKPEILLISPFKDIWEEDKTPNKNIATRKFSYIEFMTSHLRSNPYRQYPDEIKRDKIIEEVFNEDPKKFVEDKNMLLGISYLEEKQLKACTAMRLYIASKASIENLESFLLTVDLNQRHIKTGNPLYKPKDITNALKDIEDVS